MKKILTVNSHTGWHYLLSKTNITMDVIGGWNFNNREKPNNFILKNDREVRIKDYDTIILHNFSKDIKFILLNFLYKKRIILVFHGRKQRQTENFFRKILKYSVFYILNKLKKLFNIEYVFITPMAKVSWNVDGKVILPGIPIEDFPYIEKKGNINYKVAVVGNNLTRSHFDLSKLKILKQNNFEVILIGRENESLNDDYVVKTPTTFEEYINELKKCDFYFSVLKEPEEGFNLSLLEAMSIGLVVITDNHPTTPIKNTYNGIVYYDNNDLNNKLNYIKKLSENEFNLLSKNAHLTISNFFNIKYFAEAWVYVLKIEDNKNV